MKFQCHKLFFIFAFYHFTYFMCNIVFHFECSNVLFQLWSLLLVFLFVGHKEKLYILLTESIKKSCRIDSLKSTPDAGLLILIIFPKTFILFHQTFTEDVSIRFNLEIVWTFFFIYNKIFYPIVLSDFYLCVSLKYVLYIMYYNICYLLPVLKLNITV